MRAAERAALVRQPGRAGERMQRKSLYLAQDSEAETENKIKKLEAALGPFTFAFKVEALQKSI